jgi:hypothetical protein
MTRTADEPAYGRPAHLGSLAARQQALNGLGTIGNVRIASTGERGGMEVATVLFDVGTTSARRRRAD